MKLSENKNFKKAKNILLATIVATTMAITKDKVSDIIGDKIDDHRYNQIVTQLNNDKEKYLKLLARNNISDNDRKIYEDLLGNIVFILKQEDKDSLLVLNQDYQIQVSELSGKKIPQIKYINV